MTDVFGQILQDQFNSKSSVFYHIERDDGLIEKRDARLYFTNELEWPAMQSKVLQRVISPVIDLGCGGGRHSLYLQKKGHFVKSIDVSECAIEVCSQLGLVNCEVKSIWDLENLANGIEKFKTLLLFGNNIGLSGSYDGLIKLLRILEIITEPGGLLMFDYFSPIPTDQEVHLKYHSKNLNLGKRIGEMKIRINYRNLKSNWLDFYLPIPSELEEIVNSTNWAFENELDRSKSRQYVILQLPS